VITPWEIYWVLQLDSIGAAITIAATLGVVISAIVIGISATITDRGCYPDKDQDAQWGHVIRTWLTILLVSGVLFVVDAFIPSTRTMAAVIVAPKIINSPTVQHEAGDLYKLAKQALENAVAPKPHGHGGKP
jgi:hypothetical protein